MTSKSEVEALQHEIDSLHKDCRDLVQFIVNARAEISQIKPADIKQDKLPRAGKELDAIVQATESATNQIMEATERIMDARVTEADVVNDACMEIFEACSFQDITGQRISKVVSTLEYIESYLDKLSSAWGHDDKGEAPSEDDRTGEAALLNGPALEGEGVDQNYVDSMFDEAPIAEAADDEVEAPSEKKEAKKDLEPGETIDQDDIDALFN
ncbi:chemotaxis protein CheZ [Sneathiella sp. P13V-1]|uniref:protein phosphatase CheZ n=1 Tax=Sneathiella sp. P13V-1 TaxID=2697366 RepID=UPI00187B7821|nr:protein phosphatase CheZ [Sneathiella sp. P13V-1]MBE7638491.1 chemotaxis protein CheZ [Sneathiella sp. P13V-1]